MKLANRMSRIDSSGIRKIFALASEMKDPINLSIGQPDFDVPNLVKEEAVKAIMDGKNSYTPSMGIPQLREQIIVREKKLSGIDYKLDQTFITSGVSGGLFLSLMALVDQGDEVIIPDPYFVMYKHLVSLFNGTPVYLDTYDSDFNIDTDMLKSKITDKTKILLLNSPSNPTGKIYSEDTLKEIAKICEKRGITIISDEIYKEFAYKTCPSISSYYPNTLVLGGYSKSFGMTGWRLGYATGPTYIIEAMAMTQQYSFVCAPSTAQYAALACPSVDIAANIESYSAKRNLMIDTLKDKFEIANADGAFYLFIKAPEGYTGDTFVEKAIKNNILIIPGSVFSERDTHFRLCYTVENEKLLKGAEILCNII